MKRKKKLSASDFRKLNDLIAKCANCALEDSRKDYRIQKAYGESNVSDEDFSLLWSCYENSDYSKGVSIDYQQFVESELRYLVQDLIGPCFKNKNRFEIMLPVIFYSLIVQNESNRTTVVRRSNKVLSARKNGVTFPSWNLRDPYREWKKVYRPDKDEEAVFSSKIKSLSNQASSTDVFHNSFIAKVVKETIPNFTELSECFYHAKFYSDMSRAGQLLYYVLKETDNQTRALDTLIRMYCIIELQNVLQSCRAICDDKIYAACNGYKRFKNYSSKDIIKDYAFTKLRDPYGNAILSKKKYDFLVYYIGDGDEPDFNAILNSTSENIDLFEIYYTYLSENFYFEMPDIIEFYLQEDMLSSYINADEVLIQYEKALRNLMNFLPKLHRVKEKSAQAYFVSLQIAKRKDMIVLQDGISAFASEAEENAHIAKHSSQRMEEVIENFIKMLDNDPREYGKFKLTSKQRLQLGIDENGDYSVLNVIDEEI